MKTLRHVLTIVVLLTLFGGHLLPASAQGGVTVFLRPVNALTGDSITDVCLVLVDFSNVGCDENGDGLIKFADVPAGDYDVIQSGTNSYADNAPFQITVTDTPDTQQFVIELAPVGGDTGNTDAVTVYLQPIDVTTGLVVTTSCFVIKNFSQEGCDENGDGVISFEGVPPGIYGVTQTQDAPGYLHLNDFRINVHNDQAEQTFQIDLTPQRQTSGTVDIAVVPYDATTGGGLTGACVEFEGGSLEGCDDNGDGQITFQGVPVGTYQLTETQAPAGYTLAEPRFVSVQQDGRVYYIEHFPKMGHATAQGNVDVALVTRDPNSGDLLDGSCYVILDASVEGCDENSDGQVDFKGVVPGTYTVHQTKAPAGFNRIDDFDVQISEIDPTQSILIKQAKKQYAPGFRNVSVAVYDLGSGTRVTGPDVCVQLAGFSNVGCDLNSDGQIDFQDVPVGTYDIDVTSLPDGYTVHFQDNTVVVEETNPFSIANALLTVDAP